MSVEELAHLVKRNGAWLITMNPNVFEHSTLDELCDCAANLATAKRVARLMVKRESDDQATHLRWHQIADRTWDLHGSYEPDTSSWIDP